MPDYALFEAVQEADDISYQGAFRCETPPPVAAVRKQFRQTAINPVRFVEFPMRFRDLSNLPKFGFAAVFAIVALTGGGDSAQGSFLDDLKKSVEDAAKSVGEVIEEGLEKSEPSTTPPETQSSGDQSEKKPALSPKPKIELTLEAQDRLNKLGYDAGKIDGASGPQTRAAIRRFQRDQGLAEDGEVSQGLVTALRAAEPRAATNTTPVPATSASSPPHAPRTTSSGGVAGRSPAAGTSAPASARAAAGSRGPAPGAAAQAVASGGEIPELGLEVTSGNRGGLRIMRVRQNGPAHQAGLRAGDGIDRVIDFDRSLKAGGNIPMTLATVDTLKAAVRGLKPGDKTLIEATFSLTQDDRRMLIVPNAPQLSRTSRRAYFALTLGRASGGAWVTSKLASSAKVADYTKRSPNHPMRQWTSWFERLKKDRARYEQLVSSRLGAPAADASNVPDIAGMTNLSRSWRQTFEPFTMYIDDSRCDAFPDRPIQMALVAAKSSDFTTYRDRVGEIFRKLWPHVRFFCKKGSKSATRLIANGNTVATYFSKSDGYDDVSKSQPNPAVAQFGPDAAKLASLGLRWNHLLLGRFDLIPLYTERQVDLSFMYFHEFYAQRVPKSCVNAPQTVEISGELDNKPYRNRFEIEQRAAKNFVEFKRNWGHVSISGVIQRVAGYPEATKELLALYDCKSKIAQTLKENLYRYVEGKPSLQGIR